MLHKIYIELLGFIFKKLTHRKSESIAIVMYIHTDFMLCGILFHRNFAFGLQHITTQCKQVRTNKVNIYILPNIVKYKIKTHKSLFSRYMGNS